MVEVSRDLSEVIDKQDHLEQVSQDHVQMTSEYLQGWRHHSLSGHRLHQSRATDCSIDLG